VGDYLFAGAVDEQHFGGGSRPGTECWQNPVPGRFPPGSDSGLRADGSLASPRRPVQPVFVGPRLLLRSPRWP